MADRLLEASHVDVFYGAVHALQDLSFHVGAAEFVGILGGNASGKSTAIKSVLGLVPLKNGSVRFDGEPIDELATPERIALGMASVPEGRRVFPVMSVRENLLLGAYVRRGEGSRLESDLEEVLDLFPHLQDRLQQAAGTLSGGEQQMLAMARAMMRRPRLICIDEPSMGLSPRYVDIVYEVLANLKSRRLTMLVVEQNANRALEIADRAYILRSGALVRQGAAVELRRDPDVRRAYLGG